VRTNLILVLATVSSLAVGSTAQEHTIVAVATVKQLCEGVITASSDAIFNVGREIPSNDDEWRVVHDSALLLAESGNLLMLGNRARDRDQWMAMAQELVESGVTAVEAAEGRDVDALFKAGDQIVVVCEKCHEPYRDGGRSMPIR